VYSYCGPSRATLVTGLYPHNNGAFDNSSNIFPGIPTVPVILNNAGYATAMMGKYFVSDMAPGFDYWLYASPQYYVNGKYNYNGVTKPIPGHNTDVLTDSTLAFIARTQQPFYIWLAYHAPT
jgi:arylsulfatase A-like enzyme